MESARRVQPSRKEAGLSAHRVEHSTNQELLASKAALQTRNEELAGLVDQLQDTLKLQRTTTDDLQNVLYSADLATVFLDLDLNIRFFTPAVRLLFDIAAGDVGRPLADLRSLSADAALLPDVRTVLRTSSPLEREIEARSGACYSRRVLPYRGPDQSVGGVVITFADITVWRRAADALEAAKHRAELADDAKSRILATANHDLRQPLQALSLMRGILAGKIKDHRYDEALTLVARLDETAASMLVMLNTLVDINQLESGVVHFEVVDLPIDDLLGRLGEEFNFHAHAHAHERQIDVRVVRCAHWVRSDPHLLEQMIRNLLSNALKYTRGGKVLLGCRHHRETLSIEVWDTGIGIPNEELRAIFGEYHQLGNVAQDRTRGLGLGLSIVQRLADLMGHGIRVRSWPGKGSMFAIDVALAPTPNGLSLRPESSLRPERRPAIVKASPSTAAHGNAAFSTVFVVDDDSGIRASIGAALEAEGCAVVAYASCEAFLAAYQPGAAYRQGQEACILVDAYLPGMSGLELLHHLRDAGNPLPAIMITGSSDVPMAVEAMKAGALDFIEKPIGHRDLLASVERALELSHDSTKLFAWHESAARQVAALTSRQRQIMDLVLAGNPSKNIAADLGISQRTVENHRASIMEKTGAKSVPALARLALAAASVGARNSI